MAKKQEVLRILIPGSPDNRIKLKKGGEITIKGTIDFKGEAGVPYGDSGNVS